MEHELTDPANLYFNGASNVYNPEIQNALSQVGAQGLGGPSAGNPAGPGASPPSGTSGGLTWQSYQNDLQQSDEVAASTFAVGSLITLGEVPVGVVLAGIAYTVDFLVNFFEDIFGGGSSPPIPRQLMHRRHPLYGQIIGILESLMPTEASPVSAIFAGLGAAPSNVPPLQRADYSGQIIQVQFWGYNSCGPGNNGRSTTPGTVDDCCTVHDKCYGPGLSAGNVSIFPPGRGAGPAQQKCDQALCNCLENKALPSGPYDAAVMAGAVFLFCYDHP